MKLFTDVKIGKRLAIGFGIALALMAINLVIGISLLGGISSSLDQIVSRNSVKIKYANNIRSILGDITLHLGEIATASDPKERLDAKGKIDGLRSNYKKSMDELAKLESSPEGKSVIEALNEELGKGKEGNNKVIELGLAGDTKGATEQYSGTKKALKSCLDKADAIIRYNESTTEQAYEHAKKSASTGRITFVVLGIINILVGVWLSRAITRSIAIPIVRSSAHIDLMAKGDFSIPVSEHALKRKDEMGIFATSMHAMNTNIRQILTEMKSSAASVASASTQLSVSAERLSGGAVSQVDMATQVATASTEMNQATEDIARNSSSIAGSAGETVRIAKGGQEIVEKAIQEVNLIAETVETVSEFVRELGQESDKIGNIVTTINDIADQTNLLALNAAIEAARAGEHGRGFAVVADEVKKLAERSSASTTEIGNMINSIRGGVERTIASMDQTKRNVESGVQFSSQAQTALNDIITSIDSLYNGIQQTASAIDEMSATTDEITRDINKISDVTKETLVSSEEISGAATGLSGLARNLEQTVATFKV
jgi:methyl-accepting chemotaxis protein